MYRVCGAILAVSLLTATNNVCASDCGNGPIICTPMYGLYDERSLESKLFEQLFQKLVDRSNNDRARFFSDPLAVAVSEVRSGAKDKKIKFWVIVTNPTSTSHVAKFYVMVSKTKTTSGSVLPGVDVNCPIAPELCPQRLNPLNTKDALHNHVVTELRANGEIVAETKVDVPPNAMKAVGIAVPDDDDGDKTAIALLGGSAPGRLKLDSRDILRLGFADR